MPITNPSSISNCVVWLDATDITTLYSDILGSTQITGTDGEYIKCWKDKMTGKLFVNTDIGVDGPRYAPSFHSIPSIQFLSTNSRDTGFVANFTQSYESCMVFVVAYTDNTSNNGILYGHVHSTATLWTDVDLWGPLRKSGVNIRNTYAGADRQTVSINLSSFNVFNSYIDNDPDNGFGVGIGRDGNYNVAGAGTVVTLQDSKPMTKHSVGKDCLSNSSGTNFLGYIGEILVYNKMLNPEEIQQVENYLCEKWLGRKSDTTIAKSSGNWSDSSVWLDDILPEPHQIVYSGNKEITIDSSIEVKEITNRRLVPKNYIPNGKFTLNGNFNIKANIRNATENYTKNCLEILTPTGVVDLSGNILEISNSTDQNLSYYKFGACVVHSGNCDLNVFGNIGSGQDQHYGVYHSSLGRLNVYGKVYSSLSDSACIYLPPLNSIGKVTVYGDVIGDGGETTRNNAISNNSANGDVEIFGDVYSLDGGFGVYIKRGGTHIIHGNVLASTNQRDGGGIWIDSSSVATVHVYGDVYADDINASTSANSGSRAILSSSIFCNLYIHGDIYNKGYRSIGVVPPSRLGTSQAIVARKINLAKVDSNIFYRKSTNTPSLSFHSVGNYDLSLQPPLSDIVLGFEYGQGPFDIKGTTIPSLYGQMKIPTREVVRVNEIIGTERGIAVFQPNDLQHIWDCDFEDVAINNNTTADYIIKLMSVSEMGKIISENNT